jgi:ribokinase
MKENRTGKYSTRSDSANILVLGDLCVDVIMEIVDFPQAGGDGTVRALNQHAGGSAANTAIMLAKLGETVSLFTPTGGDEWGRKAVGILKACGVNLAEGLNRADLAGGMTFVLVDKNAERTLFTFRGANAMLNPDQIDNQCLAGIDFLHISAYSCMEEDNFQAVSKAVSLAKKASVPVSLDISVEAVQRAKTNLLAILPQIGVLVLSGREALALAGMASIDSAVTFFLDKGVSLLAIKKGAGGCRLVSHKADLELPGFTIPAVDSTGAGDAFCAGLIYGLVRDWLLEDCGLLANALGALAVSRVGAGENLPSVGQVITMLESQPRSGVIARLIDNLSEKKP